MKNRLTKLIGINLPLFQSPMAGVSTPLLAATVSNSGALGAIGLGAASVLDAEDQIRKTRALTSRPFNVNFFCHKSPIRNRKNEKEWLHFIKPYFARFNVEPPTSVTELYKSFNSDHEMLEMVLAETPAVVSFHFGLPDAEAINRLHSKGILLAATATNLNEAQQIQNSGIDIIIAQGFEAGGHRGMFSSQPTDEQLNTGTLVQLLKRDISIPIVAAGGIMEGVDIENMMNLGADGIQMGTAFLLCPESSLDETYRQVLLKNTQHQTYMTSVISGRPARCIANEFVQLGLDNPQTTPPDYPLAYSCGKQLSHAAKMNHNDQFGAHWAGQGINRIRQMPAQTLIHRLVEECSWVLQS